MFGGCSCNVVSKMVSEHDRQACSADFSLESNTASPKNLNFRPLQTEESKFTIFLLFDFTTLPTSIWNTTKLAGTKLIAKITQIAWSKLFPTCRLTKINVKTHETFFLVNLQEFFIKLGFSVVHGMAYKFDAIFIRVVFIFLFIPIQIKLIFF